MTKERMALIRRKLAATVVPTWLSESAEWLLDELDAALRREADANLAFFHAARRT